MSRSCQSATFSSPTVAAARTTRARPQSRSETIGIPLVRHRGRALLAAAEGLLNLADLGAREVADLGGEALDRRGANGQRREELGMPVARDHLCGDRFGHESETGARDPLHLGVAAAVDPDRT